MKTEFTRSSKDNVATAALVTISLFFFASGVFNSSQAAGVAIQKLDTIVVTAPRAADATLDTIVVAAPRLIRHA